MILKELPSFEFILEKIEYVGVNMAGCIIAAIIIISLFTQEVYVTLFGIEQIKHKKVGWL